MLGQNFHYKEQIMQHIMSYLAAMNTGRLTAIRHGELNLTTLASNCLK